MPSRSDLLRWAGRRLSDPLAHLIVYAFALSYIAGPLLEALDAAGLLGRGVGN